MFKNEACEMLKIKELTHVNEVLSMSVTKLLDIIDKLYLNYFEKKVGLITYIIQAQLLPLSLLPPLTTSIVLVAII